MQNNTCKISQTEYNINQEVLAMRKTCPYCKMIMVPVCRFSKSKREYLLKCSNCHYEERTNMILVKNNASKLVKAILGTMNANVQTG